MRGRERGGIPVLTLPILPILPLTLPSSTAPKLLILPILPTLPLSLPSPIYSTKIINFTNFTNITLNMFICIVLPFAIFMYILILSLSPPLPLSHPLSLSLIPLSLGVQLCWRNHNNIINILHQVTHNGIPSSTATPEDHQPIPKINSHTGVLEISPVQTPNLDSNSLKDCSKQALSSSYTSFCACLQSLLVKEEFLDHWLTSGCASSSLAYLMPCSLLHAAWNHWPLVCDPHGFASRWIKEYAGEELICIDGRDR